MSQPQVSIFRLDILQMDVCIATFQRGEKCEAHTGILLSHHFVKQVTVLLVTRKNSKTTINVFNSQVAVKLCIDVKTKM